MESGGNINKTIMLDEAHYAVAAERDRFASFNTASVGLYASHTAPGDNVDIETDTDSYEVPFVQHPNMLLNPKLLRAQPQILTEGITLQALAPPQSHPPQRLLLHSNTNSTHLRLCVAISAFISIVALVLAIASSSSGSIKKDSIDSPDARGQVAGVNYDNAANVSALVEQVSTMNNSIHSLLEQQQSTLTSMQATITRQSQEISEHQATILNLQTVNIEQAQHLEILNESVRMLTEDLDSRSEVHNLLFSNLNLTVLEHSRIISGMNGTLRMQADSITEVYGTTLEHTRTIYQLNRSQALVVSGMMQLILQGYGNTLMAVDGEVNPGTVQALDYVLQGGALNNVRVIAGNFKCGSTSVLTEIKGLNMLTQLGGHIYFRNNVALTTISGINLLTSVGHLYIYNNDALIDISGLNSTTFVRFDLNINSNDILANISGLRSVTRVGGGLMIFNNPLLSSSAIAEGLANLQCHRGIPYPVERYCTNCPAHIVSLPRCA